MTAESKMGKRKIEYIGEWRKGIAIGYSKDSMCHEHVPNLINKNNELLYVGYACADYVEEIYRTSKGYYVVTEYRDMSAPGKDSDYRGPFLKCVISEDGSDIIHHSKMRYGHYKNDWYDSDDTAVFRPKEMGCGIIENEHSFYRLDDFKKLFEIPKTYKIESIFEHGYCLLSVPDDNRDFIVTVKAKEIIDYFDVNDAEKLFKLIDKTNDSSLIRLSSNEETPSIRAFKKQLKQIEEQKEKEKEERLNKVKLFSACTYPRHYISEQSVTIEEFMNGITISKEELMVLQELHKIVSKEGERIKLPKYAFHLRKIDTMPDICLDCLFYSDFILLRMKGDGYMMYRFYSLDGKCLSDKIFGNLRTTKNNSAIEYDDDFNNHVFRFGQGIVIVNNDKITYNPYPDFMCSDEDKCCYPIIRENYIAFKGDYYDFYFNKLEKRYVNVEIKEVIKNYLYRLEPKLSTVFASYDCLAGNKNLVTEYCGGETLVNGEIHVPIPQMLDAVESELHFKDKNIPNHITEVLHIGDYEDMNEERYALYLFKCRPHGYCDTSGNFIYDFNPNKIVL